MKEWVGAPPAQVRKDGKYRVVSGSDGYEVQVIYRINNRERALLATSEHAQLVDLVNEAKVELTGQRGGAFYINEFRDVLVPRDPGTSFWIGTFDGLLTFDLDATTVVTPKAPPGLRPGDLWPGPRVGIQYTLTARGSDLRYEVQSGRIRREVRLSDHVGADSAAETAALAAAYKQGGGAVYINECSEMFVPTVDAEPEYIYVGNIGELPWFSPPESYDRP
jgi:hypothetical protein